LSVLTIVIALSRRSPNRDSSSSFESALTKPADTSALFDPSQGSVRSTG
jgi:hypothetical protein